MDSIVQEELVNMEGTNIDYNANDAFDELEEDLRNWNQNYPTIKNSAYDYGEEDFFLEINGVLSDLSSPFRKT